MVVSVLDKELEYKVDKLKFKTLEVMQQWGQTNLKFQHMNKSSRITPNEVSQSWLINTVYCLLVKNNKGEGRGLISIFPLKRGAY